MEGGTYDFVYLSSGRNVVLCVTVVLSLLYEQIDKKKLISAE